MPARSTAGETNGIDHKVELARQQTAQLPRFVRIMRYPPAHFRRQIIPRHGLNNVFHGPTIFADFILPTLNTIADFAANLI